LTAGGEGADILGSNGGYKSGEGNEAELHLE